MKGKVTIYKGNSPNRVERPPDYQPRAEPRPWTERGTRQHKPVGTNGEKGYPVGPDGIVDTEDFARYLERMFNDPVRMSQAMTEVHRPGNVSHAKHEIAMRSAGREPMLNADPSQTRQALEGRTRLKKNARLDKLQAFKRIVVKPNSAATGARGWHERLWSVHQLKYSRGIVAVTDEGDETLVFPQWSDMRRSIVGSGWSIIREEVPKGGQRR